MTADAQFELRGFHEYLGQKLAAGEFALSPEEALDEWRAAHHSEANLADEVAAVREALDEMAKGDVGVPLVEFDREFRQRHGLPARP